MSTSETTQIALFLVASIALIITPGPDMIFVTTRGIALGRIAGIFSALGVCAGLIVHTSAVALGLAILLKTSSVFYYTIKFLGVFYLIYLGIKTLLNGDVTGGFTSEIDKKSNGQIFLQGFITNLVNPKIALFFMSFLPQFVIFENYVPTLQIFALGITYLVLSLIFLIIIALLSDRIGRVLKEKDYIGKKIRWLTSSVFIGLGLNLAFSNRE